jgi:hypothetical protein
MLDGNQQAGYSSEALKALTIFNAIPLSLYFFYPDDGGDTFL